MVILEIILNVTVWTVQLIISAVSAAMFIRAVLSFLPIDEGAAINGFLAFITEPFILPIRLLCEKFNIGKGIPFDIPFLLTYIILSFISLIL